MTLDFICKGYYKKTQDETIYTIEISVEDEYLEYFKELLEKGELNAAHYNYTITITLRELSWFKDMVFKEVTAINAKHKYIYLAMLEWSTEDDSGLDYYLYSDYDVAQKQIRQAYRR